MLHQQSLLSAPNTIHTEFQRMPNYINSDNVDIQHVHRQPTLPENPSRMCFSLLGLCLMWTPGAVRLQDS